MGNCLSSSPHAANHSKNSETLPIQTMFKFPSLIPTFPPGEGFASGSIDLGGLRVCQISSFSKVWATHEGGPDNLGATFFEPSPIPQGFFMLGCYSQPNNKPLFGWVLAGKDVSSDPSAPALKSPTDYSLIWSSKSFKIKEDGNAYVWLPTPPDGYKAVGHVVTVISKKPPLDKIRCVRSDLTDQCEKDTRIWGGGKVNDANEFSVFGLRPINRGTQARGVCVGTFLAQNDSSPSPVSVACLKNMSSSVSSSMPNLSQIEALVKAYSPRIYFHPDEKYLPSSVSWFFKNGALLHKKGSKSAPMTIESTGSNLPQGGSDDDEYWLDLPVDKKAKEKVKRGDLDSSEAYVHVKSMLGATFTDIAIWVFYPFNGHASLKIGCITISLGRMGEHIGDWEHMTLRISNFNGQLWGMYLSQHSGGTWVNASELEFENDNKPVIYASLNGHALYPKRRLVLQGWKGITRLGIGLRNDTVKTDNTTKKEKKVMDSGERFCIVAAEHLGRATVEPPWINYFRKWGPKFCCKLEGVEGPTGPMVKKDWNEDEKDEEKGKKSCCLCCG